MVGANGSKQCDWREYASYKDFYYLYKTANDGHYGGCDGNHDVFGSISTLHSDRCSRDRRSEQIKQQ